MAIKINDNTITGDIYYNDVQVEKVYINNNLAWKALPENNITLTVYKRFEHGVNLFRAVLIAKYPVKEDIRVTVRYRVDASTTVTIYKDDTYGITGWREGYVYSPTIEGVSPQSDGTYRYTYNTYGDIEESKPIFNCLITAETTMTYYPHPVPVTKTYTLRVESEYRVEDWFVDTFFDLGPQLPQVSVALNNTKSKTLSETGKEATKCEWLGLWQPHPSEIGYSYIKGPATLHVIDKR